MYVQERGQGDLQVLLCDKMDAFLSFQELIQKILNHIMWYLGTTKRALNWYLKSTLNKIYTST